MVFGFPTGRKIGPGRSARAAQKPPQWHLGRLPVRPSALGTGHHWSVTRHAAAVVLDLTGWNSIHEENAFTAGADSRGVGPAADSGNYVTP